MLKTFLILLLVFVASSPSYALKGKKKRRRKIMMPTYEMAMCQNRGAEVGDSFEDLRPVIDYFTGKCRQSVERQVGGHNINERVSKPRIFCQQLYKAYSTERACFPVAISKDEIEDFKKMPYENSELKKVLIQKIGKKLIQDRKKLEALSVLQLKVASNPKFFVALKNHLMGILSRPKKRRTRADKILLSNLNNPSLRDIRGMRADTISQKVFACTPERLNSSRSGEKGVQLREQKFDSRLKSACGEDEKGNELVAEGKKKVLCANRDPGSSLCRGGSLFDSGHLNEQVRGMKGFSLLKGYTKKNVGIFAGSLQSRMQQIVTIFDGQRRGKGTKLFSPLKKLLKKGADQKSIDNLATSETIGALKKYYKGSSLSKEKQKILTSIESSFKNENCSFEKDYLKCLGKIVEEVGQREGDQFYEEANDVILSFLAGVEAHRLYARTFKGQKELEKSTSLLKGRKGSKKEKADRMFKGIRKSELVKGMERFFAMDEHSKRSYGDHFKNRFKKSLNKRIGKKSGDQVKLAKKIVLEDLIIECDNMMNKKKIKKRYCPSPSRPDTSRSILKEILGDHGDEFPDDYKLKTAMMACLPIYKEDQRQLVQKMGKGRKLRKKSLKRAVAESCRKISQFDIFENRKSLSETFCKGSDEFDDFEAERTQLSSREIKEIALPRSLGKPMAVRHVFIPKYNDRGDLLSPQTSKAALSNALFSSNSSKENAVSGPIQGAPASQYLPQEGSAKVGPGGGTTIGRDIFGAERAVNPTAKSIIPKHYPKREKEGVSSSKSDSNLQREKNSSYEDQGKTSELVKQLEEMKKRQSLLQSKLDGLMEGKDKGKKEDKGKNSSSEKEDEEKKKLRAEVEELKKKMAALNEKRQGEGKASSRIEGKNQNSSKRWGNSFSTNSFSSSSLGGASPSFPLPSSKGAMELPSSQGEKESGQGARFQSSSLEGGNFQNSGTPYTRRNMGTAPRADIPELTQSEVFVLTKNLRDKASIVSPEESIDEAILKNQGAILIPNGEGEFIYIDPEYTEDGEVKTLDGRVVYADVLRTTDPYAEKISSSSSQKEREAGRFPSALESPGEREDISRRTYRLFELESVLEDIKGKE